MIYVQAKLKNNAFCRLMIFSLYRIQFNILFRHMRHSQNRYEPTTPSHHNDNNVYGRLVNSPLADSPLAHLRDTNVTVETTEPVKETNTLNFSVYVG